MDNDADQSKIKILASWNYNVNWTAQKEFIQTCQLLVVQGDTEGFFIPFRVHKHFHQCWEQFCLNTEKVTIQEGSSVPSI